jgi:hypothetical protein
MFNLMIQNLPGIDVVQQKDDSLSFNGDIAANLHQSLVAVVLVVEFFCVIFEFKKNWIVVLLLASLVDPSLLTIVPEVALIAERHFKLIKLDCLQNKFISEI